MVYVSYEGGFGGSVDERIEEGTTGRGGGATHSVVVESGPKGVI